MGNSKKFVPSYQVPFIIQNKRGEVNFHVKPIEGTAKERTVQQNRLKRHHTPTAKIPAKQVPQPVRVHDNTDDDETESDEEEVFIRNVVINSTLPIQQEHKTTFVTPVTTTRAK